MDKLEKVKELLPEVGAPYDSYVYECLYSHMKENIIPSVDANDCPPLSMLIYVAQSILRPTLIYEDIPNLLNLLAQIEHIRHLAEKQAKTALALHARYTAKPRPRIRTLEESERKALKKIAKEDIASFRLVYLDNVLKLYRLHIYHLWISPQFYTLSKAMRLFFPSLFVKSGDRFADEHWQSLLHQGFTREDRERIHNIGESTKVFLAEARDWEMERKAYLNGLGLAEDVVFGDSEYISYPRDYKKRFPLPVDEEGLVETVFDYMRMVKETVDKMERMFPAKEEQPEKSQH